MFVVRRPQFPSWSWAGWQGKVWMKTNADEASDRQQYNMSAWVHYYKWDAAKDPFISLDPARAFFGGDDAVDDLPSMTLRPRDALASLVKNWVECGSGQEAFDLSVKNQKLLTSLSNSSKLTIAELSNFSAIYRATGSAIQHLLAHTLVFRTLTADLWISAITTEDEIDYNPDGRSRVNNFTFRPALFLYSTNQFTLASVGIAWLNEESLSKSIWIATKLAYGESHKSKDRAPPEAFFTCPVVFEPGASEPEESKISSLYLSGDGGSNIQDDATYHVNSSVTDVDSSRTSDSTANNPVAPTISKDDLTDMLIRSLATYPKEELQPPPVDPWSRRRLAKARCIRKVKVAILSGPVESDRRSRQGVIGAHCFTTHRGFVRIMILDDASDKLDGSGRTRDEKSYSNWFERIGIGELELSAFRHLPKFVPETIFLSLS